MSRTKGIKRKETLLFLLISISLTEYSLGVTCQRIGSLDFCSMVNYSVVIDNNSNDTEVYLQDLDRSAAASYSSFEKKLQTFDCTRTYGAYGCDSCKTAYKLWTCHVHFSKCSEDALKISKQTCLKFCNDVALTCPRYFNFLCPTSADIQENNSAYTLDPFSCNTHSPLDGL